VIATLLGLALYVLRSCKVQLGLELTSYFKSAEFAGSRRRLTLNLPNKLVHLLLDRVDELAYHGVIPFSDQFHSSIA
jgi:hypothetical protein